MTGDRATSALAGTRFADLRWVAETGSTNADLLAEARAGAADGVVVVADHQTAGRGRLNRTWEAPPGGSLLFSVLLRPGLDPDDLHLLSTAVGVSALLAIEDASAAAAGLVGLKWPNDLVVATPAGERKVAGILAESLVEGGRVEAVVVGMGINIAWRGQAADELAEIAAALDGVGVDVDREDLLVGLLGHLAAWLDRIGTSDGRAALAELHRQRCVTLGRTVRVELADGVVEGEAVTIDDAGRLVVEPAGGSPVRVTVGDVIHVRSSS